MAVMMLSILAPLMAAEETTDNVSTDTTEKCVGSTDGISKCGDATPNLISTNTEVTDSSLEEEAALDDNATTSTGEIMGNQIRTWFTFNQEKKLALELKLADLRLIQARIAAKNGNTNAMEKAMDAHERILNKIQERMGKLDGASDEKGLNASANNLVGLERAIQVHELKIERLNTRLANANLTEEQKARIEAKITKAEGVTSKIRELQQAKLDKVKTRLMAVRNLTEDEAEEIIAEKTDAIKAKVQDKLQNRAGQD